MTKKAIFAIIGFSLFIIGFLALFLMLVGVQLSFLSWIDAAGKLLGFIIRLGMIVGGGIIIFLSQTDWNKEEPEHDYLMRD